MADHFYTIIYNNPYKKVRIVAESIQHALDFARKHNDNLGMMKCYSEASWCPFKYKLIRLVPSKNIQIDIKSEKLSHTYTPIFGILERAANYKENCIYCTYMDYMGMRFTFLIKVTAMHINLYLQSYQIIKNRRCEND